MPAKIDKKRAAAIQSYYDTLVGFAQQYALHEGAVSVAFQTLLADTARSHHWTMIDQYQVSEDKRPSIKSDPNREDDEEYIVRLVGQVVRVSVETVKIVDALPVEFAETTPSKTEDKS
jgi:predicted helicase